MKQVKVLFGTPERAMDFIYRIDHFPENMDLCGDNYCVSAKSVIAVFSSNLRKPISLVIYGSEAQTGQVLEAIRDYIVEPA